MVVGEYGTVEAIVGESVRVRTRKVYENPVVIVGSVGMYDPSSTRPLSAHVADALATSFTVRTVEGSTSASQYSEVVSYLVLEAGDYTFEDGSRFTAGYTETRASAPGAAPKPTPIPLEGFRKPPRVLAGFMDETSANAAAWSAVCIEESSDLSAFLAGRGFFSIRGDSVSRTAPDDVIEPTLVGYVAFEPRSGVELFNAKRAEFGKHDHMHLDATGSTTTRLISGFHDAPMFLATMGCTGFDESNLRMAGFNDGQFKVTVQGRSGPAQQHPDPFYHFVALEGTGRGNPIVARPRQEPSPSPSAPPTPDLPKCSNGLRDDTNAICCAGSCGTCGECGCEDRGDVLMSGEEYCCPSAIRLAAIPCELSSDVGCVVYSTIGPPGLEAYPSREALDCQS